MFRTALRFLGPLSLILLAPTSLAWAAPEAPSQSLPAPDALTAEARKRFNEGLRASAAGDFERARLAFLQTYALKQAPEVLRNLAMNEIAAGHLASGARHLSAYLRGPVPATETAETRALAERTLREAEAKLGRLAITVNAANADVFVDEAPVGRSPIPFEWHVDPGPATVVARKDGVERRVQVATRAGVVTPVSLELPLTSEAARSSAPSPSFHPAPAPVEPPSMRRSIAETWSTPLLVTGIASAVLAGAALGGRFVALHERNSAREDARDRRAEAVDRFGEPPCTEHSRESLCQSAQTSYERAERAKDWANASTALAGIFAATSVVAFGSWFYVQQRTKEPAVGLVQPWLTPQAGGLNVRGQF